MEKWTRKEKKAPVLLGFWKSVKNDTSNIQLRYKHKEELLRNIQGNIGLWARYKFLKKHFKKIGKNVFIWPGLRIKHPNMMEIGDNVQLGYDNHYQASKGIKIGDNTIIAPSVNIWTINHVYSDMKKPINAQGFEKKSVEIGENCWITTNCFILPGAKIPAGCVVLPNSVVGQMHISPDSIIGGNPAKVLSKRSLIGRFKKY